MADCYKRETWALGTSTLISTEEARFISLEEADFYGGSRFLRGKQISTEEADFYGGG